jgi:ATP-dependent RNA helicase DeaD
LYHKNKREKTKKVNEQETISGINESGSKGFESLGLNQEIMRALKEAGYDNMFPIQERSIPLLIEGRDLIGQAHTGSGKTAAYSLPMIQKLDGRKQYVQALVVVPTRELALQVTDEFNKLAKHTLLRAYPIYGGQSITPQIERLRKRTPQVIVATPGRLIDHIERETIELHDVQFVVLDEADRMLDMGFIDDVDYILKQLPSGGQIALFSATMPSEVRRLSNRYMNRPVEVLIDSDEISLDSIEQTYALIEDRDKFPALVEYIRKAGITSGIVFCGMKFKTQKVAERLQAAGFKAMPIHGDLSQNQREHAMRNFRSGHVELLVATDVAARGIDVPAVGHVINYDVPQDPLTYFHRIGRTARAGRDGSALTFVSQSEYPDFSRIMGMTKVPIRKNASLEQARTSHEPSANFNRSGDRNRYRSPRYGERRFTPGDRGHAQENKHEGRRFAFTENVASSGNFRSRRGRRN